MTKRTLISGGAGFIGSHLCDFLLEKGHHVICMDNLLTGSMENIQHLLGHKNFEFIHYDITHYVYVQGKLDYILHFASPASPVDYLKYPIQTLKVGSIGTQNLLGLAKQKNATFLLASTSEVYGDPEQHPQSESYFGNVNPIGPRSVYDEAKRFAEALVMAYHRHHQLNTRIVRIFNTYGPRMRIGDGRVMPAFISQALQDQPITVFGDGSQTRSFCYVSDLVEGIYQLLNSNVHTPVNLGNDKEITILDFAKEVISLTNSRSTIEFHPLPQDDPKIRKPDLTKAKKLLHWEPKVSRKEGLVKTIRYFQEKLKL
ncbi:MAG: SDR family oxidoreductase [Planctomycetota bacterium]|nr:MAG: SDR family oxidoreductase [Planctomycetota bacterium]